jgi:NADH-quinone oxidoreductase subunit H
MTKYLESALGWGNFSIFVVAAVAMLLISLFVVCYLIYFERKFIGWMQFRHGPTRTGPFGLLQSMADVLKLLIKEDIIPSKADRIMFILAPGIVFVPSFVVLSLIPYTENLYFTNLDVGVLFYVAVSSISIIGFVIAGWASNNKFSLMGGMRAAAQMVSYAVPLVLSMAGVILISGTMNIRDITIAQDGWFWHWNFLPQILGFVVFVIAAVAELNRTPFDLAEAENELIAGYHVEYTGFRFAFFMLSEYIYMIAMAGLATSLFLGGWHSPAPFLDFIPGIIWFGLKWAFCVFFLFWLRSTMPRMRTDQLMSMGWKWLLPIALLNVFLTAIYMEIVR